jgi:hypothetical protein
LKPEASKASTFRAGMIVKRALLLFFSIISVYSSLCQTQYEFGIEGGFADDKYKVSDQNGNLITIPCISGIAGISFRWYSNKKLFYEIAALAKQYNTGFALKQQSSNVTNNAYTALMLPLRAGYNLNLSERVSLVPVLGVAPVVKISGKEGSSGSLYETNSVAEIEWHYTTRPLNRNFYALVQGGLGLEFNPFTFPGLKFSISANYYYQWLKTVSLLDIDYKINNGAVQKGNLSGKGRFLNGSIGVKYAFLH